MINTSSYQTKEFSPIPSPKSSNPKKRLRKPQPVVSVDVIMKSVDLDFLSDFIKAVGFYIEELEDLIEEDILDFWQTRDHALHIITEAMLERAGAGKDKAKSGTES
ncbi:MAG: hypothetical protein Q8916_13970 [Bacteroidota bacterium]|nr:hypothetical protein [Bacteroidota bacterium]